MRTVVDELDVLISYCSMSSVTARQLLPRGVASSSHRVLSHICKILAPLNGNDRPREQSSFKYATTGRYLYSRNISVVAKKSGSLPAFWRSCSATMVTLLPNISMMLKLSCPLSATEKTKLCSESLVRERYSLPDCVSVWRCADLDWRVPRGNSS